MKSLLILQALLVFGTLALSAAFDELPCGLQPVTSRNFTNQNGVVCVPPKTETWNHCSGLCQMFDDCQTGETMMIEVQFDCAGQKVLKTVTNALSCLCAGDEEPPETEGGNPPDVEGPGTSDGNSPDAEGPGTSDGETVPLGPPGGDGGEVEDSFPDGGSDSDVPSGPTDPAEVEDSFPDGGSDGETVPLGPPGGDGGEVEDSFPDGPTGPVNGGHHATGSYV